MVRLTPVLTGRKRKPENTMSDDFVWQMMEDDTPENEERLRSELNTLLCVICDAETDNVFNINFKKKHICEDCANSIFLQQANFFVNEYYFKKNNA